MLNLFACLLEGVVDQTVRKTLLWDEDLNPLCPADQTMLSHFMRHVNDHYDILQCAKCHSRFNIHDDEDGNLTLGYAKDEIRDSLRK